MSDLPCGTTNKVVFSHFFISKPLISLADFKEQKKEQKTAPQSDGQHKKISKQGDIKISQVNEEPESRAEIVNRLEGKILNQLIQQIDPKVIPKSRFRIKQTPSKKATIAKTVTAVTFAALMLLAIKFPAWESFVTSLTDGRLMTLLSWTTTPITHIVVVLACFVIAGISLYCLMIKYDLQTLLKKVNVKDIGVEVFQEDGDSFFDRYLNEVLYLFEQSGADAIVFEDLDRYDVTEIFGKLREISALLYQRKRQSWKKKDNSCVPKFFYLLREDVFTIAERTKFLISSYLLSL